MLGEIDRWTGLVGLGVRRRSLSFRFLSFFFFFTGVSWDIGDSGGMDTWRELGDSYDGWKLKFPECEMLFFGFVTCHYNLPNGTLCDAFSFSSFASRCCYSQRLLMAKSYREFRKSFFERKLNWKNYVAFTNLKF